MVRSILSGKGSIRAVWYQFLVNKTVLQTLQRLTDASILSFTSGSVCTAMPV